MLVGQPLTVYHHTNLLCHWSSFLLVLHEVDYLQPFIASFNLQMCPSQLLCNVFYFFSNNAVADFVLPTHFQNSPAASAQMPRVSRSHFYRRWIRWETTHDTGTPRLVLTVNSLLHCSIFNIPILSIAKLKTTQQWEKVTRKTTGRNMCTESVEKWQSGWYTSTFSTASFLMATKCNFPVFLQHVLYFCIMWHTNSTITVVAITNIRSTRNQGVCCRSG